MGLVVGGLLVMTVRCDLSIPAVYFRFSQEEVHSSVEEDSELLIEDSGDLIAIRVYLAGIFEDFPELSPGTTARLCLDNGWTLASPSSRSEILPSSGSDAGKLHSVSRQLRKGKTTSRRLIWPVIVDLDRNGEIIGFELLLEGNTDGPVRVDWLCDERNDQRKMY